MALNDQDRAWIRQEIQGAFRQRGFWSKFKDWIPITVVVAIGLFVLQQWGTYVEFKTRTSDRLDNIENKDLKAIRDDLKEIRAQLAKQTVTSHLALPQSQFQNTLSEIGRALITIQETKASIQPAVLSDLSKKLVETDHAVPDYWPLASWIINYRSSMIVGTSLGNWSVFPPCPGVVDLDSSPDAYTQKVDPKTRIHFGPKVPIERIGNQDCMVQLDGHRVSRWDCKHCIVKYSGGPLSLHDVRFENCLFIFDFPSDRVPQPSGERLSETLLASNLTNVEIKKIS